jgi:hypothetical protein
LRSAVYATRVVLATEKGVPAAVVTAIRSGGPFIDADIARRGKKIAREEARSGRKKARKCAVACEAGNAWRLRSTDEMPRLPLRLHKGKAATICSCVTARQ